ncbi:MAG: hypothetical protein GXP31_05065 [Kiritimatiellaeota bacterium]|nr:hypothetical protein [Kiritimatiellota bacterium]
MRKTATGLLLFLLAPAVIATSGAEIATVGFDAPWTPDPGMEIDSLPKGGPADGPWLRTVYSPGSAATLHLSAPLALPPGAILKVWVKGNGTRDRLSLYLFGGTGHRAYNLALGASDWRELSFDISEDFGENTWTWATPRSLDIGHITGLKLYAPKGGSPGPGPVGIGPIRFELPRKGSRSSVVLLTCRDRREDPAREYRIIPHLRRAGFEVQLRRMYGVGSGTYLAADQLARFNAAILLDMPRADKGEYPKNFSRVARVLHEYVEKGGGLFFTAMPSGWNNAMPTINRFLDNWGAAYLNEQVVDPENLVQSPAWFRRYPFAWTENVAPHTVTADVGGTWFPAKAWRADGILTTAAVRYGPSWTVVVGGGPSALSVRPQGNKLVTGPPLTYKTAPPIMAVRQAGRGRLAVLPIASSFLTAGCDHPAWRSMVWDGGANRRKSNMKSLFLNTVRWLVEPSRQSGVFGGFTEPSRKPDFRPEYMRPLPIDWEQMRFRKPNHNDYRLLVGVRSSLSGGTATPQAMIDAAKAAGYDAVVFTEPVRSMDAGRWRALTQVCAQNSSATFLALPGLRYRDPQGNHYLLFGTFTWPDAEWRRKCFNERGEVIDTYTLYAKVSGWRHVVIHSIGRNANPVLHLRHYSCMAVFTYDADRLIDDAWRQYLLLEENCYYPVPLAVHFVSTPTEVEKARAGFQTRMWARDIEDVRDKLDGGKAGQSYFWNPKPTYLSSGVRLLDWQELNMNSWRARAPGTDKWKFRFALASEEPITEVNVMDGTRLYRCFRPRRKRFTVEHTGYHGKQNQFTLRARDARGGEMISSHLKTHTMEHVFFMCADRQNSLGEGSWGYQTWPAQYGTAPKVDIRDLFPPHWDGTQPGHSSFCTACIRPAPGFDARNEDNLSYMASTNRTLMASRDCTITELVGDKKFLPPGRKWWSDCKPTAPLRDREFLTQRVRRWHFRVPEGVPGFMLVEGSVKSVGDFLTRSGPDEIGVLLYSMGDRGGKNGELDHFAFTAAGQMIVRQTPAGTPRFVRHGSARKGDCFAEFPRRLGAPVIFPLTDTAYRLYADPNLFGTVFGERVPGGRVRKGTAWRYRFLYAVFAGGPGSLNETPQRIRTAFGLTGRPGYKYRFKKGRLVDSTYWLRAASEDGVVLVDLPRQPEMPGGLPLVVDGLNERWSAVVAERETDKGQVRFIGVLEKSGYALVDLRDRDLRLLIGHPVRAGDDRLFIQLLSWGSGGTSVEVHNPTPVPIRTWVAVTNACARFRTGKKDVTVPPGTSVTVRF